MCGVCRCSLECTHKVSELCFHRSAFLGCLFEEQSKNGEKRRNKGREGWVHQGKGWHTKLHFHSHTQTHTNTHKHTQHTQTTGPKRFTTRAADPGSVVNQNTFNETESGEAELTCNPDVKHPSRKNIKTDTTKQKCNNEQKIGRSKRPCVTTHRVI